MDKTLPHYTIKISTIKRIFYQLKLNKFTQNKFSLNENQNKHKVMNDNNISIHTSYAYNLPPLYNLAIE